MVFKAFNYALINLQFLVLKEWVKIYYCNIENTLLLNI